MYKVAAPKAPGINAENSPKMFKPNITIRLIRPICFKFSLLSSSMYVKIIMKCYKAAPDKTIVNRTGYNTKIV